MLHDFTIITYYNLADCLLKIWKFQQCCSTMNVWDTETTHRLKAISVEKKNQTLPLYTLSLQHYWGADSATTAVFEAF